MYIMIDIPGQMSGLRSIYQQGGPFMAEEHLKEENSHCVSRCDEEFVECIDHYGLNCLHDFNQCASSCDRE